MPDNDTAGAHKTRIRVRFAADPASVPGARRIVSDGLAAWELTGLADDATLCVSELAGNAALHSGGTFMHVGMVRLDDAVRISVEDDVGRTAGAVAPRSRLPSAPGAELGDSLIEDEPTTGRGLAIVSVLASDWGVEMVDTGKRVWADIAFGHDALGGRRSHSQVGDDAQSQHTDPLPPGWVLVRLEGCPVQLSLRQDDHLDELIRELQLMAGDRPNPRSAALASRLQGLLVSPAHARYTGRRIAERAAAAGREFVDIDMAMPREFSDQATKLKAAIEAADALCEELQLLTLASSDDLRKLRAWMSEQIVCQIEQGSPPISWSAWSAGHG